MVQRDKETLQAMVQCKTDLEIFSRVIPEAASTLPGGGETRGVWAPESENIFLWYIGIYAHVTARDVQLLQWSRHPLRFLLGGA